MSIKFKIELDKTELKRRLDTFTYNLPFFTMVGVDEAANELVGFIKDQGKTLYSDNLEVITDMNSMISWISPRKEFFEGRERASDEAYQERFHKCTYAKYLMDIGDIGKALERINESKTYEPRLQEWVIKNKDMIKQRIIKSILGK